MKIESKYKEHHSAFTKMVQRSDTVSRLTLPEVFGNLYTIKGRLCDNEIMSLLSEICIRVYFLVNISIGVRERCTCSNLYYQKYLNADMVH